MPSIGRNPCFIQKARNLFTIFSTNQSQFPVAPGVHLLDSLDVTLLGSPLLLMHCLQVLSPSSAVFRPLHHVLKLCLLMMPFTYCVTVLPIPKLLYLLRTSPSWRVFGLLEKFNDLICTSLQTVANINISSSAWAWSILPAVLGIHSVVDLSLPSFLSSLHSSSDLVSSILSASDISVELIFLSS